MQNKKDRTERAKQFMPFAALKGFEDLVNEQTRSPEKRRELCEEDIQLISEKLAEIEKNDLIEITYYKIDGYTIKRGAVSEINFLRHYVTVVKEKIFFEDITKVDIIRRHDG